MKMIDEDDIFDDMRSTAGCAVIFAIIFIVIAMMIWIVSLFVSAVMKFILLL